MAKIKLRPGINAIAAHCVVGTVQKLTDELTREAKQRAPALKTWVSRRDGRVRHTHEDMDLRAPIPENLRFAVISMRWDIDNRPVGPFTYMRWPRDESSHAVVNLINCRCMTVTERNGMARWVSGGEAQQEGEIVVGIVTATGPDVVKAELGDTYDPGDLIADPTYFMSRSASAVAARSRARTMSRT